jgi:hypothetical protein
MAITRFVAAPSLEMYFVDKTTGEPLSNGTITFYKDNDRSVLKDVYQLSGLPPYSVDSFVTLPNPLTLSSSGTIVNENGDNVIPYFFPYEGTPTNTTNAIELYYIVVESEAGTEQFTREAWPPNATSSESNVVVNDIYNYIPNGQFLAHTNISASSVGSPDGIVTEAITPIAQGGWYFYQNESTASVNKIFFTQQTSFQEDQPTSNPRYAANIVCSGIDLTDTVKDLRIRFPNVNKFGSADLTDVFTFSITGKTTNFFNSLDVYLIKNYGTGGSAQTEEVVGTLSFDTFYQINNVTFPFGSNTDKTIGTLNDDYVEIAIRFPLNTTFDITVTDAVLTHGNVTITAFPDQTNADMLARSIAGWMPTPAENGADLYLPVVLTKEGMKFDDSAIGDIVAKNNIDYFDGSISTKSNELLAYGDTYKTSEYSPLGIPYSRYQSKIYNTTLKAPIYGTGPAFVDTYVNTTVSNDLRITTNAAGSASGASDVSTTITFSNIHTGANYGVLGYVYQPTSILVIDNGYGAAPVNANAHTSGFSIATVRNNAVTRQSFVISGITSAATLATGAGNPAKYFTFTNSVSGSYYVWFRVTSETDPAPGGTGIQIKLTSTDNNVEVTRILRESISGYQVTKAVVPAGSSIPAGSYFTFSSPTVNYYAWFKVSGAGNNPNVPGRIAIQINIESTDTNAQVTDKIRVALNSEYFATPNLRGWFLRGIDPTNINDPGKRYGILSTSYGPELGTFELDEFSYHTHSLNESAPNPILSLLYHSSAAGPTNIGNAGGNEFFGATLSVGFEGSVETRPVNAGVIWAVKY